MSCADKCFRRLRDRVRARLLRDGPRLLNGSNLTAVSFRQTVSPFPFRPSQQLILRVKRPAAVGRIAVEGQQAVSQKLDAALQSPVAVAEGPEHGGGVQVRRSGEDLIVVEGPAFKLPRLPPKVLFP